ncbi:MAG: twin transmembrane helix small protein [Rickettsiales bacterium]|nr:twin transmembrane helix small protein [Rickettsiales bacterium]
MEIGNIILLMVMLGVVLALVVGIALMMRGGEANKKYGNKLMTWRVGLQGLSLVVLGVLFLMSGK